PARRDAQLRAGPAWCHEEAKGGGIKMGPEDFRKFAETLSHVAKLYGVRLTDEKVSLFFDACRSLSPEQFAVGIKRHVKRGKFFPSPSELFEALFGTEEDQAMLAWCDVLRAVRACGSG